MKGTSAKRMVAVISSFAALALVVLCAFAFLYLRRLQVGAAYEPPTVIVTDPLSGAPVAVSSHLSVSATALGRIPITRTELWLDGSLQATQNSDRPDGVSVFYAYFDLPMPEGYHTLFVRAVNTKGILGQSLPITVVSTLKSPAETVSYAVRVGPGESLEDIAQSHGTDPGTLRDLNPDLGGQEPPPGAVLKVPRPPEEKEQPAPGGPPTLPGPGGTVTSTVPIGPPTLPGPGLTVTSTVPLPNVPMLTPMKALPIGDLLKSLVTYTSGPPPTAPTDLKGQTDGCDVILTWKDNATDESHYDVWMSLGMLMPRVVASLKPSPGTGQAWVKFPAGQEGYLTFWVEAVNSSGKQPSNDITLLIPTNVGCGTTTTDYLQVEVYDMNVTGNYDKVYCYVSYEAAPEKRMPATAGEFIQVKAGKADFSDQEAGFKSRMVPVPKDGSLDIEGKCLGWSGGTLKDLGPFSGKFAQSDWDGARRTLKASSYDIEFAVKPYTVGVWSTLGVAPGMYGYEDPTLKAPYAVNVGKVYSPSGNIDPRERAVTWKWDGDAKKIKGFAVYLDGVAYSYVDGANTRQAYVYNPNYCGKSFLWQVRAVADPTQSSLSAPVYDKLAECKTYAMVKFESINATATHDGWGSTSSGDCDTLDAYFYISVNGEKRGFWGGIGCRGDFGGACTGLVACTCYGGSVYPFNCGVHTFKDLTYPLPGVSSPDVFIIPATTDIDLKIRTDFWDFDAWSGDDEWGIHEAHHYWASLQAAQNELGCGKSFTVGPYPPRPNEDIEAWTYLTYSITVFPNSCSDIPPRTP